MRIYNTLTQKKEEFIPFEKTRSVCMSVDRQFIIIFISEMQDRQYSLILSDAILNTEAMR